MAHSTKARKFEKPRPDFPLFPHATGRWAKKVRGRLHYFGRCADDPKGEAALAKWLDEKDDLLAGRTPNRNREGLTIHQLCNAFIAAKDGQAAAGDIALQTFVDYRDTCKLILDRLGKTRLVEDLRPTDFESLRAWLAKRYAKTTLANEVQRIRTTFKYAVDAELIGRAINFGPTFKRPAKRILRADRQSKGSRMFEARELRKLLKGADVQLRAMLLLGINCGFGNSDCGRLPHSALDLKNGWVNFPRPKTAIERRCKLWPETIEALREAMAVRPRPKNPEHADLVFVTKYGGPWAKETSDSPISNETRKLLDRTGIYRPGLGFYCLRRGFETIGGDSRDQVAVDFIMGHSDPSMGAVYRQRIEDSRLEAVAAHVRRWLFRRDSAEVWRSERVKCGVAG